MKFILYIKRIKDYPYTLWVSSSIRSYGEKIETTKSTKFSSPTLVFLEF